MAEDLSKLLDRGEFAGTIGGEPVMVVSNRDLGDESDAIPCFKFSPVDEAVFAIIDIADALGKTGEDGVATLLFEVCILISFGRERELSRVLRPIVEETWQEEVPDEPLSA